MIKIVYAQYTLMVKIRIKERVDIAEVLTQKLVIKRKTPQGCDSYHKLSGTKDSTQTFPQDNLIYAPEMECSTQTNLSWDNTYIKLACLRPFMRILLNTHFFISNAFFQISFSVI